MADKERAKKLAAAKKKLKAYKSGDKQTNVKDNVEEKTTEIPKLQNYFSNKGNSNDFLLMEEQQNPNGQLRLTEETQQESSFDMETITQNTITSSSLNTSFQENNSNHFNTILSGISNNAKKLKVENTDKINTVSNTSELLKTIEVLISEKAHLSKESSKLRISCKEKDFEIEEIKTRLEGANKRVEELEKFYFSEQRKNMGTTEQMKNLETELHMYKNQSEENSDHIDELKHELSINKARIIEMEKEIKEKSGQLELNNIRINQISDEKNITIDNRIETLTQTKFMYEQQIVDLQSTVQQLRAEKEQANQQYQNYVQHLDKDMASLSEKNSELTEENTKLAGREQELVDHISNLEKEIQQNIAKNENLRHNMKNTSTDNEEISIHEDKFKTEIEELKRSELELKKTLEEKLNEITQHQKVFEEKSNEIILLQERISNLESARPNDAKLLASIESDKVAASRAMSQNSDLRKQLDEVQLKLIELTNDKMDLTNTLDSERFANKQSRQNFEEMQSQIKNLSDQLHFKDEEMIRLSHENNELGDKLTELQKINEQLQCKTADPVEETENPKQTSDNEVNVEGSKTKSTEENIDFSSQNNTYNLECCEKDNRIIQLSDSTSESSLKRKDSDTISLPTSEAMWRLEERFKKLMTEVADLSDEKQQLEHLVLQLQGETETIGEYIALYQSQRKILKQKEYERDAQLMRLLAEREDLRNKAMQLDVLIKQIGLKSSDSISSSLIEILNQQKVEMNNTSVMDADENLTNGHHENQKLIIAQEESNCINDDPKLERNHNHQKNYNYNINKFSSGNITESDSQKIIDRIQSLVADLKINKDTLPLISTSVDHCACCSGNLETI